MIMEKINNRSSEHLARTNEPEANQEMSNILKQRRLLLLFLPRLKDFDDAIGPVIARVDVHIARAYSLERLCKQPASCLLEFRKRAVLQNKKFIAKFLKQPEVLPGDLDALNPNTVHLGKHL
jgi:hypothetical protein